MRGVRQPDAPLGPNRLLSRAPSVALPGRVLPDIGAVALLHGVGRVNPLALLALLRVARFHLPLRQLARMLLW